jgi:hypothetical protein
MTAVWSGLRWSLAGFLALGFFRLLIATNQAGAAPLDLGGYRQALQTALSDLQSDQSSSDEVAATLKTIDVVTLPDGSTLTPDLTAIVNDLEPPADQANAEARLAALLGQIDQVEQSNATNPDDATASLNQVLARSEFQPKSATKPQTLVGWVLHQIGRVIKPILQPLGRRLLDAWRWIASLRELREAVAVVIGVVALSALGLWALRGLRRGFAPGIARLPFVAPSEVLHAVDLRKEAEELAGKRSYRLAIRALYLAALLRLDERDVLSFDRALTNREVLKNAGRSSGAPLVERLAPLVERFDRHWYGAVVCTENDYREFARLSAWAWEVG